jgi:hypothetical protein
MLPRLTKIDVIHNNLFHFLTYYLLPRAHFIDIFIGLYSIFPSARDCSPGEEEGTFATLIVRILWRKSRTESNHYSPCLGLDSNKSLAEKESAVLTQAELTRLRLF